MVLISRIDHSREPTLELERLKIKCYRFECSECREASSIQVFYRKDGSVGYAGARHKNKQGFYYHKQSVEYVMEKLGELGKLDQGQYSTSKAIDPELHNLSQNLRFKAGPMGNATPEEHLCCNKSPFFVFAETGKVLSIPRNLFPFLV